MKTLLQINTNVGWNSTGRIAEDIGRSALSHGWLSTIAYGRNIDGVPSSASKLVRIGNDRDIIRHGLMTRIFDRHGLGSKTATRGLIKRIEEISPDVIQLHNIHGYYLNYEELFAYLGRTGVPVVWTLHDSWPITGHCAYFEMAGCDKWLNGCSKCPLKKVYPASYLFDRSASNYARKKSVFTSLSNLHIVTVSHWLKGIIRQSYLDRFPSYVIHNGIDLSDTAPSRVKKEKLILGVASKWDSNKGLDTFIRLRRLLPSDFRMVVIGLTGSQILGLPSGIEGLGRINERNVLNEWYRKASVLLNSSLSETLSMTNIEAQACGTPVVGYKVGAMSETVNSGILVKAGDIDGLGEAVRTIISNPKDFSSEKCRSFVKKHFDKHKNYEKYVELYDSLVAARNVSIPELLDSV